MVVLCGPVVAVSLIGIVMEMLGYRAVRDHRSADHAVEAHELT